MKNVPEKLLIKNLKILEDSLIVENNEPKGK